MGTAAYRALEPTEEAYQATAPDAQNQRVAYRAQTHSEQAFPHNSHINQSQLTPLMLAAQSSQDAHVIQALIAALKPSAAADHIEAAFLLAASFNPNPDILQVLIDAGANVNTQLKDGATALFLATAANQPAVINTLIQAGARVNQRNESGYSALMYAAGLSEYPEVIRLLLAAKANGEFEDQYGRTAFDLAK